MTVARNFIRNTFSRYTFIVVQCNKSSDQMNLMRIQKQRLVTAAAALSSATLE